MDIVGRRGAKLHAHGLDDMIADLVCASDSSHASCLQVRSRVQTQSAHDSNILACTKTRYHQCIAGVVLMDEHSARGIVQQELGRGGLLQHALNDAHELHSHWKTDHRTDAMPSFNLVMQSAM